VDERKQLESQLSSLQGQIAELLASDDREIGKDGQSMLLRCNATLLELIKLKHERSYIEPLLCRWVIDLLQLQSFDSSILQPDHAHDLCRILSDVGLVRRSGACCTRWSMQRICCAAEELDTALPVAVCCRVEQYEPRLLYRATRDGFSTADFWRCCAGKGPTLTLVKVGSTPIAHRHCLCAFAVAAHR